jgi:hypothetical protein
MLRQLLKPMISLAPHRLWMLVAGTARFWQPSWRPTPEFGGVLLDQEPVVLAANSILGPLAERCTIHPLPAGGDIYALSQILHDWNDERCLKILANCHAAMKKDSRLLVIERVLDAAPGQSNRMDYFTDMHMMMLFPGAKERTLKEFARLFREVGFSEPRLIRTRSPYWIVEMRPTC